MTLPVVFMFSGQSSQYYRMGQALYEHHARFRMWMDYCDEIVEPMLGVSLCEILYRSGDRSRPFDRLLHTNPALVSLEFSLARVLMEAGARPDRLLGYSLGEIGAAIVGGALDIEDGLRFSIDYARLLEAQSPPATMIAVVNAPAFETRYAGLMAGCEVTARNFDEHIVVTGPVEAMARLREVLVRDGVLHQPLAVNFGFHTGMIEPLREQVIALAGRVDFRPLKMPVVSCLDGGTFDARTDPGLWPEHLWAMSRHAIAFDATIRRLLGQGDHHFLDVGPSGTLSTFVKYLLPTGNGSVFGEVINPFGKDLHTYGNALRRLGLPEAQVGSAQGAYG